MLPFDKRVIANTLGIAQETLSRAFARLRPFGVDVERVPDGVSDTLPGCMAFSGDPECPAMMAPLGLRFEDNAPAGAQTVFSARAQGGQ